MKKLTYVFIILSLCLCVLMLSSCEKTYEITYVLDGGVNSAENPSEYQKGEIVKLNFPKKEGYMFAGWYSEPEHKNLIMEINADTKDDITLYARWERVEDVLTFELVEDLGAKRRFTYSVTDCVETAKFVIIPERYNNRSVTYVGFSAFENCEQLEYVYIADTIFDIENAAFSNCKALKDIYIPDNIGRIYDYTFQNCDSLKEVTLGKNTYRIGQCAFADCDSLSKVDFPGEEFVTIGMYAFSNCDSLKEIEFNKVGSFSLNAFDGCDSLEKIVIHNCYRSLSLHMDVFNDCPVLKEVVLGDDARMRSYSYGPPTIEKITVSENNKYIMSVDGVVYSKDGKELICYPKGKKDKEFTVPIGVTHINSKAFSGNEYIESVTIPDGVEYIGADTFSKCTNLKSVDISDSVKEIGARAFVNCSSLKTVKLSNSIERINASTFSSCSALEIIKIPEGVRVIEANAFYNCISLQSITIPYGVESIGIWSFGYCSLLKSIIIPNSVIYVEASAFEGTPLVVYCEAEAQPDSWDDEWAQNVKEVIWGYKEN